MNGNRSPGARLVLVSNRGPFRLRQTRQGLRREKSVGGLVTSLLPLIERRGGAWVAWGEVPGRHPVPPHSPRFVLRDLQVTPDEVQHFYQGFANSALWPLCHYFSGQVRFERADWEAYEAVNRRFAAAALEEVSPDGVIWVHDYQLARVPLYIAQARPEARPVFFWHIPFPAVELFRALPWRRELLEGMLASATVGFHIQEYADNFVEAAVQLAGARQEGDTLWHAGSSTRVLARPIGIDVAQVTRDASAPATAARAVQLRAQLGLLGDQRLLLGVERMDYTKGIGERLRAVEYLLERHHEWHRRFTLLQIVTPSRGEVEAYRESKRVIDEAVGRINGRFSDGAWIPIRYLHRTVAPAELLAYYRAADVALVTPLRDGLNLVAKEYVVAHGGAQGLGGGALVLSEFAGVSEQLPEAVLVNPYSLDDLAAGLERALRMLPEEQRARMQAMYRRIQAQDINWWAAELLQAHAAQPAL